MTSWREPPPQSVLAAISYDPDTGIFTWHVTLTGFIRKGFRADTKVGNGPRRRVRFQKRSYQASRLAWFFHYGEWPDALVDHKNCDPSDNRIANLRLADHSQNSVNYPARGRWMRGVTFHKQCGKFQAQIRDHNRDFYLGLFDTEELAHAAYMEAARRLHGEFARSD